MAIVQRHTEKHRKYHTLNHLKHIFGELRPVENQLKNLHCITLSVFFHDIIYQVKKSNNEEKSAAFAKAFMEEHAKLKPFSPTVHDQIIATKHHKATKDSDTNFLIDADMAILGQPREVYREYTENIRKEYQIYPDFMYRKGRRKVVTQFLTTPQIFHTDFFHAKYQKQAEENLHWELTQL